MSPFSWMLHRVSRKRATINKKCALMSLQCVHEKMWWTYPWYEEETWQLLNGFFLLLFADSTPSHRVQQECKHHFAFACWTLFDIARVLIACRWLHYAHRRFRKYDLWGGYEWKLMIENWIIWVQQSKLIETQKLTCKSSTVPVDFVATSLLAAITKQPNTARIMQQFSRRLKIIFTISKYCPLV